MTVTDKVLSAELESLVDPMCLQSALDVGDSCSDELHSFLEQMETIRAVERRLAKGRKEGDIGGPVHLGVGQEAVAVGVSKSLSNSDTIFGAHRSHSHILAAGTDIRRLFAEVLGRDTGLSRGMGGSMHLIDESVGFMGSTPIVAGTVSLAVGSALAHKLKGNDSCGISYLGDGAVEEGVVHEAFNLARIYELPILFVVENNLFASHMHISQRQPLLFTSRFAVANDIPFKVVDGNNVLAVSAAAKSLIHSCRSGNGPGFLECITYRWYGHVDWREDIDVGVHRSAQDLTNWRARDPVRRLSEGMQNVGMITGARHEELCKDINRTVESAWTQASLDPYPEPGALKDRVFHSWKDC